MGVECWEQGGKAYICAMYNEQAHCERQAMCMQHTQVLFNTHTTFLHTHTLAGWLPSPCTYLLTSLHLPTSPWAVLTSVVLLTMAQHASVLVIHVVNAVAGVDDDDDDGVHGAQQVCGDVNGVEGALVVVVWLAYVLYRVCNITTTMTVFMFYMCTTSHMHANTTHSHITPSTRT